MLSLPGSRRTGYCDGLPRRDFLKLGALGLAGLGLPELLRAETIAGKSKKSVIYICLSGGPSHIDMYDMKPDAPADFRGEFRPMPTRIPGLDICDLMPLQAGIADRYSLLRGVQSVENDHFLSEVYTGLARPAKRPAFGSIISKLLPSHAAQLPPYVSLSGETIDQFEFERPGYAGAEHAPFRLKGEGRANLTPTKEMTLDRLEDRKALLRGFDTLRRDLDARLPDHDGFTARALELIASEKVRDAFDLTKEPDKVRARFAKGKYLYNKHEAGWDNSPLLLARRLVEAGARLVTLSLGTWDHHGGESLGGIFPSLKTMLPLLDQGIHALLTDLQERGLDRDVLVVVLGEFGRSPKVNEGAGRDHWAEAGCVMFSGGGLEMGQVIGETDSRGERNKSKPYGFQNIVATIYHVLGIDPQRTIPDFTGRPMHLLDDRRAIEELI